MLKSVIRTCNKMFNKIKSFFENDDLNTSSWLINWGYMTGYLKDGQIQTNKYCQQKVNLKIIKKQSLLINLVFNK